MSESRKFIDVLNQAIGFLNGVRLSCADSNDKDICFNFSRNLSAVSSYISAAEADLESKDATIKALNENIRAKIVEVNDLKKSDKAKSETLVDLKETVQSLKADLSKSKKE